MTSPERKFEVGNDYKMSVGQRLPLPARCTPLPPRKLRTEAVQLSTGWPTASVLTGAL